MTARDADAGTLQDQYLALTESDRRSEGVWHTGTLRDGLPVYILALAPAAAAKLTKPDAFFAELERAASTKLTGISRPISWGRTSDGGFHCAYERVADTAPAAPGVKPPDEVAAVGAYLAKVLSAAHQAGVVHGAVSTRRILRTGSGGLQLGGFGLYPALSAGGLGATTAALLLSDIAYVSPEGRAGKPLDARSDVFSLGAMLYEFLTGKPPFGGRTTSFVMASVLSDPEGTDAVAAGSSPAVDAVLRAIENEPDDRWPTATAFAKALAGTRPESPAKKTTGTLRAIFTGAWFPARRSRE